MIHYFYLAFDPCTRRWWIWKHKGVTAEKCFGPFDDGDDPAALLLIKALHEEMPGGPSRP